MDACAMINTAKDRPSSAEQAEINNAPQKLSKAQTAAVFALSVGFTAAVIGCAILVSKTLAAR